MKNTDSCEDSLMPSFQHFQNQAEQKPSQSRVPSGTFSLSGLLEFTDSAKKQSFAALCNLTPLVKSYRDKIEEVSQAMIQTESSLGAEAEVPAGYGEALELVKESFRAHLASLDEWMSVLKDKRESQSDQAIKAVKQSGERLQGSLQGLTVPE